jgi:hypothetical protein
MCCLLLYCVEPVSDCVNVACFLYYFVHLMRLCVVCYCVVLALFLIVLTLRVFRITLYTGCAYVLFVNILLFILKYFTVAFDVYIYIYMYYFVHLM